MRVGIDVSHAAGNRTGTGVYSFRLVESLLRVPRDGIDLLLYGMPGEGNPFEGVSRPDARFVACPRRSTTLRTHLSLPRQMMRDGIQLFHSLGYFAPLWWPGRTLVTFHDVNILTQWRAWWDIGIGVDWGVSVANTLAARFTADHFIAVSRRAAEEVQATLRVPPQKITVVLQAVAPEYFVPPSPDVTSRLRDRYGLARYFLAVGVFSPIKNFEGVLKAFAPLAAVHADLRCVIVGRDPGSYHPTLDRLVRELGIGDRVVFTGYLPEEELIALYAAATGFVFPSFSEGFGLPIVEAMAAGAPVITSNRSVMPEVAGDAALLVDPADVSSIREAMSCLLGSERLRSDLTRRGRARAARRSWDEVARETLSVYETVLAGPRRRAA